MPNLFAALLGVANQNQQGKIQGQQTLRSLAMQQIENYKNLALANQANSQATLTAREADPSFAGLKAGSIAQAQQPFDIAKANLDLQNKLTELKASGANAMEVALAEIQGRKAIANAQIAAENSRQQNQQTWQSGENRLNREATATNQANAQTATRETHLQGIRQTQSGELVPNIMHGLSDLNPVHWFQGSSPSGSISPDERQQLKGMGYTDDQINSITGGSQ